MSAVSHGILLPNLLYCIKASGRDFMDGRFVRDSQKRFQEPLMKGCLSPVQQCRIQGAP